MYERMHVYREKQLVEIGELGAMLKDNPKIPVRYLDSRPDDALAHTALVTVALQRAGLPACGLQLTPDGEVQMEFGTIPQGALIMAVNGNDVEEHAGRIQRQSKSFSKRMKADKASSVTLKAAIEDLCDSGDFVNVTFVVSTNLIPTHRAELAAWLLPENLHPDYKRDRDDFAAYRRATELLRLVFDDITRGMPERTAYEESNSFTARRLIQLGPEFQDDHGQYQYKGEQRLTAPPYLEPNAKVCLNPSPSFGYVS